MDALVKEKEEIFLAMDAPRWMGQGVGDAPVNNAYAPSTPSVAITHGMNSAWTNAPTNAADAARPKTRTDLRMDVRLPRERGASTVSAKPAYVMRTPSAATTHGMKFAWKNARIAEDAAPPFPAPPTDAPRRRVRAALDAVVKNVSARTTRFAAITHGIKRALTSATTVAEDAEELEMAHHQTDAPFQRHRDAKDVTASHASVQTTRFAAITHGTPPV